MMKHFKLQVALNITQIIILIGAIVVTVLLMPYIWLFKTKAEPQPQRPVTEIQGSKWDLLSGFADVTRYGAIPNDEKDDTAAFLKSLETGASLYVPAGVFEISETLVLKSQTLRGVGAELSIIRGTSENTLVIAKGSVVVEHIGLGYADSALTNNEQEGERVAIYADSLSQGSRIRGVSIRNVGSGIYSPADKAGASFSTIEAVVIADFTFKAIDLQATNATLIRASTVQGSKNKVASAVRMGGAFTVEGLMMSDIHCDYPMEIRFAHSAVANSLMFERVKADKGNLIQSVSSTMNIRAVTALQTKVNYAVYCEDDQNKTASQGTITAVYSDTAMPNPDNKGLIKIQ